MEERKLLHKFWDRAWDVGLWLQPQKAEDGVGLLFDPMGQGSKAESCNDNA